MMLNKLSATKFQLVELKVLANTNSTRLYFQDQPNLRDKTIEKIEFYDRITLSPTGLNSGVGVQSSFVTFADSNGDEFIQNINIHELNGIYGNANTVNTFNKPFTILPRKIVFPKSFVSYSVPNPVPFAYSILFGIYYR